MAMAMGAVQISRMWRLNRELRRLCNAQFNLSNRLFYLLFRQAISPTKLNLGETTRLDISLSKAQLDVKEIFRAVDNICMYVHAIITIIIFTFQSNS